MAASLAGAALIGEANAQARIWFDRSLRLICGTPIAAAEMDCSDANMTKANADMEKMPAGDKKTMGIKEMAMAKEMMEKKNMAACKQQMTKATEMGMEMSK